MEIMLGSSFLLEQARVLSELVSNDTFPAALEQELAWLSQVKIRKDKNTGSRRHTQNHTLQNDEPIIEEQVDEAENKELNGHNEDHMIEETTAKPKRKRGKAATTAVPKTKRVKRGKGAVVHDANVPVEVQEVEVEPVAVEEPSRPADQDTYTIADPDPLTEAKIHLEKSTADEIEMDIDEPVNLVQSTVTEIDSEATHAKESNVSEHHQEPEAEGTSDSNAFTEPPTEKRNSHVSSFKASSLVRPVLLRKIESSNPTLSVNQNPVRRVEESPTKSDLLHNLPRLGRSTTASRLTSHGPATTSRTSNAPQISKQNTTSVIEAPPLLRKLTDPQTVKPPSLPSLTEETPEEAQSGRGSNQSTQSVPSTRTILNELASKVDAVRTQATQRVKNMISSSLSKLSKDIRQDSRLMALTQQNQPTMPASVPDSIPSLVKPLVKDQHELSNQSEPAIVEHTQSAEESEVSAEQDKAPLETGKLDGSGDEEIAADSVKAEKSAAPELDSAVTQSGLVLNASSATESRSDPCISTPGVSSSSIRSISSASHSSTSQSWKNATLQSQTDQSPTISESSTSSQPPKGQIPRPKPEIKSLQAAERLAKKEKELALKRQDLKDKIIQSKQIKQQQHVAQSSTSSSLLKPVNTVKPKVPLVATSVKSIGINHGSSSKTVTLTAASSHSIPTVKLPIPGLKPKIQAVPLSSQTTAKSSSTHSTSSSNAPLIKNPVLDELFPATASSSSTKGVQLNSTERPVHGGKQLPFVQNPKPHVEKTTIVDINGEFPEIPSDESDASMERVPWAETPNLKRLAHLQQWMDPDDIFGNVTTCNLDAIFAREAGKFRKRTSSANWSGDDRLTPEEILEYRKRMGYE